MKRISQLDGVRGIAILIVLVWHYFASKIVADPKSIVYYFSRGLSLTWSGVDLFFVLSGFLIAGILLDHRDTSNYFRVFYIRRACRIFPLYFLLLTLFVCLTATSLSTSPSFQWLLNDPLPIWLYATFTQNILMAERGGFGPHWLGITWSLAVEEQFYIFVPLLVYFLPRRVLLAAFLLAILTAPILRCVYSGAFAFISAPVNADALLSGASLAVLVRWHPFMSALEQNGRILISLLFVLLAGTVVMTLRPVPFGVFNQFWLAGLYTVFVLIAFAGTEPHLVSLLRFPVLVWFGRLSYGIYMFHEAVNGLLHGALRHSAPQLRTASDAGITLLALCVTLLLAMVSYHFFESPILRIGHRIQYAPKARRDTSLRAVQNAV